MLGTLGLSRLLLKLLSSIIVARILGPGNYGFLSLVELINKYSILGTLGVTSGVKREIPYMAGKNASHEIEAFRNTGYTATLIYSSIMIIAGMTLFFTMPGEFIVRFSVGITFLGTGLYQLYLYFNTLLLAEKKFSQSAKLISIEGVFYFLISIIFVSLWGIYGILVSLAALSITMIFIFIRQSKVSFKLQLPKITLRRLIAVGFPILAVGFLYTVLITLNRVMIAKYYGMIEAGYFAFGMLVFTVFSQFFGALGEVLLTYMNEHIGKHERVDNMHELVFYPALVRSIIIPCLAGYMMLLLPVVITHFLPQYLGSIDICLSFLIVVSVISGSINVLGPLLKQKVMLLLLIIAISINILMSYYSILNNMGIVGVSVALILSLMFYHYSLTTISMKYLRISLISAVKYFLFITLIPAVIISSFIIIYFGAGPIYFRYFPIVVINIVIPIIYYLQYKKLSIIPITRLFNFILKNGEYSMDSKSK
jgi:O-antigen/teichoic acid export membrane protein